MDFSFQDSTTDLIILSLCSDTTERKRESTYFHIGLAIDESVKTELRAVQGFLTLSKTA
ncbi:hypothetical protein YC2023_081509 [Brassica napus]